VSQAGLELVTCRPAELEAERLDGWFEAQSRGFHQGRTTEEHRSRFREHLDADDVVLRGVWQENPALGSGHVPVATYSSYDKTINTGNTGCGLQPVRLISDVTVSPTHRRRGLLRTMMVEDLQDAVDHGVPLAVLTASEGSIYGRFGFGPAVFQHAVTVDTSPRFALRGPDDDGSVVLMEPAEAWPVVSSVFTQWHQRTRGSVERPQFYRTMLTAEFDFENGPDRMLRTAVHLDAAGTPDGYVAYRPGPRKDRSRPIKLSDLVALTPAAYLRLWRFLADLDLSDSVEWSQAPVEDPVSWALVDPFLARVTRLSDALWVRVLDVPAALGARPWGRDGEVVVQVADPLGHAAGRFRVVTREGIAEVTATDADADVLMDADVLGALHLGGVAVETLRRAGRLSGGGVQAFAAMADCGPAPYCLTAF
jgi:predicted acetyltransferase